jgi:hypothetical protein
VIIFSGVRCFFLGGAEKKSLKRGVFFIKIERQKKKSLRRGVFFIKIERQKKKSLRRGVYFI